MATPKVRGAYLDGRGLGPRPFARGEVVRHRRFPERVGTVRGTIVQWSAARGLHWCAYVAWRGAQPNARHRRLVRAVICAHLERVAADGAILQSGDG